MSRYAQVAVDLAAEGADRLFTYLVPAAMELVPGNWVQVPFGPRQVIGCYIAPVERPPAGVQIKAISALITDLPPLPPDLIELARWVADRYLTPFAAALRLLIPAAARRRQVREKLVAALELAVPTATALAVADKLEQQRAGLRARVLRLVAKHDSGPLPMHVIAAELGQHARTVVGRLVADGLLHRRELGVRRDPLAGRVAVATPPPVLTAGQAAALRAVEQVLDQPGARLPVLLHGVTGSGKTEVYLQSIARVLARGRQAIVLVPEIALTPQTVARFRARFGEQVAVLHSALSEGERFDEWIRIRQANVQIVVGARSAVFAPCPDPGLIVLDEEHEGTYKQADMAPAYHAREVAEERCRRSGALLLLGSATPAVETYWRTEQADVLRVELPERVDGRALPPVQVVDMREELRAFNRSIFSQALQSEIRQTLADGEQAILFLNRRGYNTFVLCRSCGEAVQCPHCAVALTYHLPAPGHPQPERLECHYCNHLAPVPRICPGCKSKHIRYLGAGTERVEDELRRLFPELRVLRMDVDTTRRKGAHAEILDAFGRGEADVLIGTQMVAKGLDFGRVTLVGVILADTTLNLPDFRSAERTFQLVTQVAGRAGRGERPGRVVVQTYQPEHPAISSAARHDYHAFFREHIEWRRAMGYPPFSEYIRVLLVGQDQAQVAETAAAVAERVSAVSGGFPGEVIGPMAAPLARLRGQHRHHVLLQGTERAAMVPVLWRALRGAAKWKRHKEVRLSVDVGPYSIL